VNAVGDVSTLVGPGTAADDRARRVLEEGETVLAAAGIPLVSTDEDDVRRGDVLRPRPYVDDFRGSSLAQSRARGLPTEVDYRVGEIVLLGRLHGVPTPASEEVLRAARA
jgi:2-dehydropantoate 2-reductase